VHALRRDVAGAVVRVSRDAAAVARTYARVTRGRADAVDFQRTDAGSDRAIRARGSVFAIDPTSVRNVHARNELDDHVVVRVRPHDRDTLVIERVALFGAHGANPGGRARARAGAASSA
jgi:hypothetical protein